MLVENYLLKHMLTLLSLYHFFRRKCKPNILLTLLRDKLKSVLEEVYSTKIGNDSPLISWSFQKKLERGGREKSSCNLTCALKSNMSWQDFKTLLQWSFIESTSLKTRQAWTPKWIYFAFRSDARKEICTTKWGHRHNHCSLLCCQLLLATYE